MSASFWNRLLQDESGTGLTSHFSFYLTTAVVLGGAWYLWGDRVHGLVQMVSTTMPPSGPGSNLR